MPIDYTCLLLCITAVIFVFGMLAWLVARMAKRMDASRRDMAA